MTDRPTDPTPPADPDVSPVPPKRKARWGRRLLIAAAVLLLLVVGFVALLPTLVSTAPGTSAALNFYNGTIPGRLTADDLSVGWFGGTRVGGLKLYDERDAEILAVRRLDSGLTLADALRGRYHLGDTDVDANLTRLVVDGDGRTNYEEALNIPPSDPNDPTPEVRGTLTATLTGTILAAGGPPVHLDKTTLAAAFPDGLSQSLTNELQSSFRVGDKPGGSVSAKGTVAGLLPADGRPAAPLTVDQVVGLKGVDLAAVAPLLALAGIDVTAAGTLDGDATVALVGDADPTIDATFTLAGGRFAGAALGGSTVATDATITLAPGKPDGDRPAATAVVTAVFDGLKVTSPDGQTVPVEQLALDVSAWGNPDRQSLSRATAAVRAGDGGSPVVDVLLTADGIDSATQTVKRFDLKLDVTSATWLVDRLRPLGHVPESLEVSAGEIHATAAGSLDGGKRRIVLAEPFDLKMPGVTVVADGSPVVSDADLRVLLGGTVAAAGESLGVDLNALTIETPFLTANKGDAPIKLAVGGDGAYTGGGEVKVSADLVAISQLAGPPAGPEAARLVSGRYDGRVTFAGDAKGVTVKSTGQARDVGVDTPSGDPIRGETVDVDLTSVLSGAALADVRASGTVTASFLKAVIRDVRLDRDAPADDPLSGLQRADLTIDVPDVPKALAVAAAFSPPEPAAEGEDGEAAGPAVESGNLSLVLNFTRDAAPKGAKGAAVEPLQLVKGKARLRVPALSAGGAEVAGLDLPITIARGRAVTGKHKPATINEGELTLSGLAVDLTGEVPRLSLAGKDRLRAVVGARLNPLLSDQIGKFVGPQFANATQAAGAVDVTVLSADGVALGEALFTEDSGSARIALSVRDLQLENKLWSQTFGLVASAVPDLGRQAGRFTSLQGQITDAEITLSDGRVRQDLTFSVLDPASVGRKGEEPTTYPLTFRGGVSLASLELSDFTFSFPRSLLGQWLGGDAERVVQLLPEQVALPLAGTSKSVRPQFDAGSLIRQGLDNQVRDRVGDLIGGGRKPASPRDKGGDGKDEPPKPEDVIGGLIGELTRDRDKEKK